MRPDRRALSPLRTRRCASRFHGSPRLHRVAACLLSTLLLAVGAGGEELRVGMAPCHPPWSFSRAADGSPASRCGADAGPLVGSDVDVAEAIADRIGVRLRVVPVPIDDLPSALESGKFDVLLNAWDPRSCPDEALLFSMPYQDWGLMIAVRRGGLGDRVAGYEDLAELRVGYVRRPWLERTMLALRARRLTGFDSAAELEAALLDQKVDAIVHDSPWLRWRTAEHPLIRTVGDRLTRFVYAAAVRSGDRELRDRLTRAIAELQKNGELERIRSAWHAE